MLRILAVVTACVFVASMGFGALDCNDVEFANPSDPVTLCSFEIDSAGGDVVNTDNSSTGQVCVGIDHNNSYNVDFGDATFAFNISGAPHCANFGAGQTIGYSVVSKRNDWGEDSRLWLYFSTPSCNPLVDYEFFDFEACP